MFRKGDEGKSQSNEDDIIAAIFALIGEGGKRFIEFGCGDGRQNNTIALLNKGWSGVWLDVHRRRCLSAKLRWAGYPVEIIRRKPITPANVNRIVTDPLDFLSIDVDGPDLAIWREVRARPRVVCIEYAGSGLLPMRALAIHKGYMFHSVSESEVNAFFISREAYRGISALSVG